MLEPAQRTRVVLERRSRMREVRAVANEQLALFDRVLPRICSVRGNEQVLELIVRAVAENMTHLRIPFLLRQLRM